MPQTSDDPPHTLGPDTNAPDGESESEQIPMIAPTSFGQGCGNFTQIMQDVLASGVEAVVFDRKRELWDEATKTRKPPS